MKQKLVLFSDTFLWRKGHEGLLYHSKNNRMLKFKAFGPVEAMCRHFEDVDNLYSIVVEPDTFDESTRYFVKEVEAGGFGKLVDSNISIVSLPPLLNIQSDVKRLGKNEDRGIGENVLDYLSTLTIYIGGPCLDKPYFKQIIYPVYSKERLEAKTIRRFLIAIGASSLHTINLVVSDAADSEIIRMG